MGVSVAVALAMVCFFLHTVGTLSSLALTPQKALAKCGDRIEESIPKVGKCSMHFNKVQHTQKLPSNTLNSKTCVATHNLL
jgi:hypothetical protein